MWIDENASNSEQNKVFASKIVVTTAEGEIIKSLADQVELGDYIRMTPTSTSYTPLFNITGCMNDESCMQNTINPSELDLWRVIKKNDDGTVDVVSEYVSITSINFIGKIGYLNFIGGLNEIAAQYTNPKYVQSTRYLGYSNQTETCTTLSEIKCPDDSGYETDLNLVKKVTSTLEANSPSGEKKGYFIASRKIVKNEDLINFHGRAIYNGEILSDDLWHIKNDGTSFSGNEIGASLRPILTLKANNLVKSGDGTTEDTAYIF